MRRFSARRFSVLFGLSAALGAAMSCSAGGNPGSSGGRLGDAGSGSSGASAGVGSIKTDPNGATGNLITDNGGRRTASDDGC